MDICSTAAARHVSPRRTSRLILSIALAAAGTLAGSAAFAQSTSTHIFGWGPAGQHVVAKSSSGLKRTTTVKDNGRYDLRALPMGIYTVSLMKGDQAVDTRPNIPLTVGRGAEVDFACEHDQCAASADGHKSP